MAKQTIPYVVNWGPAADLMNANFAELYDADVGRSEIIRGAEFTNQAPGLIGQHDVEFGGVAINGPSDAASLSADNIVTFNQIGWFHLGFRAQAGRTTSSGVGRIYIGAFVDFGTGTFEQAGDTLEFVIPNSDTNIPYQSEAVINVTTAGWRFKVVMEVTDQADAGLIANTSVPSGWDDVPSANLVVSYYKFIPSES